MPVPSAGSNRLYDYPFLKREEGPDPERTRIAIRRLIHDLLKSRASELVQFNYYMPEALQLTLSGA